MSSKKAASVPGLLSVGAAEELAAAIRAGEKRKRRTHPYAGELGGPPCTSNDEWARRYLLLFEHYGLQPWDWPALAVALAITHVPGLKVAEPAKRGRPRKDRRVQVTNLGLTGTPMSAAFGPGLLGYHKKKGGREKELDSHQRQTLLTLRERWRVGPRPDGVKDTDANFLRYFCKVLYDDPKLVPSSERKKRHLFWKNQLSRARKVGSNP